MKNLYVLSILTVFISFNSIAQNLIAVQNGNTPKFFQQVDDAITNSADGDTLFIPGGSWYISKPINKRLHLIGVGHNPDSTKVTFVTTLIGDITLAAGASNGLFSGIHLKGSIYGSNIPVNSYTIFRCHIIDGVNLNSSQSNFMYKENIITGYISANNTTSAENCSFFNNIIYAVFNTGAPVKSTFKNNIFFSNGPIFSQYSSFENNIFFGSYPLASVENSTFKNNLFVASSPFPNGSTNVGSNNIVGQVLNSIFVKNDGTVYSNDYHLQSSCLGKNAGTDGTDVGIYGGIYPWKTGSIPSNPHFQSLKVSPTTDASGKLNVKIKVSAQEN